MIRSKSFDKPFLVLVIILVIGGFFIFTSASLGLLAKQGPEFSGVVFNQLFFGIILGLVCLLVATRIPIKFWKNNSLWIYIGCLALTALVFVPMLGFEHGGATRWLRLGAIQFQPAELLKFATVAFMATWFSAVKKEVRSVSHGLIPLLIITGLTGVVLLPQPDTGTFLVIIMALIAMYWSAGARWKDLLLLLLILIIGFGALIMVKPYIKDRIITFLDPSADPRGSSYQIQQSLIAVGSGEFFGRGFGQSIQKFSFLPEPIGDSIFAVAAEEFGFLGSILMIGTFILFALRGLTIADRSGETYSRLLAVGIVILVLAQSFINIGSMLGIFPLIGMPLLFISHGGTAMIAVLFEVGVILAISRSMRSA